VYDGCTITESCSLYRRHLKSGFGPQRNDPCPNSGDRLLRKGDRCPVWIEGVDTRGVYQRKSLRTTSWDIGERILREMLIPPPAAPVVPAQEPDKPQPITLSAAIDSFTAKLQGEGREVDTIRKYQLLFRELKEFSAACGFSTVAHLTFERLVAFKLTWMLKEKDKQRKGINTATKNSTG